MIGRLVLSADFERVLCAPSRARSPHFAVHHLAARPSLPGRPVIHPLPTELSTASSVSDQKLVDDPLPADPGADIWLGAVIPKRHARRAVTRSLLKRQIRAAVQRQEALPGGLWVVRLRSPFDRAHYPSASSEALRAAARAELDRLLAEAAKAPR